MLQKARGRGTVIVRSMSYLATILFSFAVIVILRCVHLASGKCPKVSIIQEQILALFNSRKLPTADSINS